MDAKPLLLSLLLLSPPPGTPAPRPQVRQKTETPRGLPGGLTDPGPVAIQGLPPGAGGTPISTEEPFVSRDGRFLFFNSGKDQGRKDLHIAERRAGKWVYRGEVGPGVDDPGSVQATPTMDRKGRFYFIDTRAPSMIRKAIFLPMKGRLRPVTDLQGIPGRKTGVFPPTFTCNMGAEVSADGKTLYYHKKVGKKFRIFKAARLPGKTGKRPPRPGLFMRFLEVDGRKRRYACYVPPGLGTAPRPLVLELHGGGIYIEDLTGQRPHKTPYKLWKRIADREKFLVLYPEGWKGPKGRPTWHDARSNATVYSKADDVKFLSTLIERTAALYPVDRRKIYISGTSNGGLMALRMAVEKWDVLAAVAAVAAAMPEKPSCGPPKHPLSVLFMNGTADKHMPYNGGFISRPPNPAHGSVLSTARSVRIWTALDRTSPVPRVTKFPNLDPRDQSTVTSYTFNHGTAGTQVVLYKVEGGGHSAPSIQEQYSLIFEIFFGKQNHDIEAVEAIWKFFKDKTCLGEPPGGRTRVPFPPPEGPFRKTPGNPDRRKKPSRRGPWEKTNPDDS